MEATPPFEIEHMTGRCHMPERLTMYAVARHVGYADMGIDVSWRGTTLHVDHARVKLADDYANLLAELSTQMVVELVKRNLTFTHARPRRQTLLMSEAHAQGFIDGLRRDWEIWNSTT